jgi:hypothetical protein
VTMSEPTVYPHVQRADEALQVGGHAGQFGRRPLGVLDALGGQSRRGGQRLDVAGDLADADRDFADTPVHLPRRRGPLLDGGRDRDLVVADPGDDFGDLPDSGDHR